MRYLFLLYTLLLLHVGTVANNTSDLTALNQALAEREIYQQQKQQRIQFLQQAPMSNYERFLALTEEYQSYSYDTATIYVEKLLDEALLSKDINKIAKAQIKQAFISAFASDDYYQRITKKPKQSSEGNMALTIKNVAFSAIQQWQ